MNEHASALGKLGAAARQRNLTPAQRKAIAAHAARTRWNKPGKQVRPQLERHATEEDAL